MAKAPAAYRFRSAGLAVGGDRRSQRTREIAVRRAIGAGTRAVVRLVAVMRAVGIAPHRALQQE